MTEASNIELGPEPGAADPLQPPDALVLPPDAVPDKTWSVEQLLDYGRKALREGDECHRLAVPLARQGEVSKTMRCPKCGRLVDSLCCGHCGSKLPAEQADLYAAMIRKLAKLGGNRADATNKGGIPDDDLAAEELPKDGDEPPAEPGLTVHRDDGSVDVEQEEQSSPGAVTDGLPDESSSFTDDELQKARDYVALFKRPFRALSVLEYVVLEHDARSILARTVNAARRVLTWGEIQEVVTAAALTRKGVKVEQL